LITLTKPDWDKLFTDVLLIAQKMTWTKVKERQPTQRDKAMEAVQDAFERFFQKDPPGLATVDEVKRYLVWTVRSELSNAREAGETRKEYEAEAVVEQETVDPPVLGSPEQMNLEASQAEIEKERDRRRLEATRRELADDPIALGTLECMVQGKTDPAEQAVILKCPVEEIYNARKRRKRAIEKVLAAERAAEDEEKA
jgi:hypothetical protein